MWNSSGRKREPIFNLPAIVTVCIAMMVFIHVARMLLSEDQDDLLLGLFAFAPDRYLASPVDGDPWPGGLPAQIWSPLTYALLHSNWLHLISNCTVFAALGNVLARRMGALRFLAFCIVMAPVSALGEMSIAFYQAAPVIGVSGVTCAMMGALARFAFPASVDEEADAEARAGIVKDAEVRDAIARGDNAARPGIPMRPRGIRREPPMWPEVSSIIETLRRPQVIRFILGFGFMNLMLVIAAPALVGGGAGVAWMVHVAGFIAGFLAFPWFDGMPLWAKNADFAAKSVKNDDKRLAAPGK